MSPANTGYSMATALVSTILKEARSIWIILPLMKQTGLCPQASRTW